MIHVCRMSRHARRAGPAQLFRLTRGPDLRYPPFRLVNSDAAGGGVGPGESPRRHRKANFYHSNSYHDGNRGANGETAKARELRPWKARFSGMNVSKARQITTLDSIGLADSGVVPWVGRLSRNTVS